jgi:hypothetical protein
MPGQGSIPSKDAGSVIILQTRFSPQEAISFFKKAYCIFCNKKQNDQWLF